MAASTQPSKKASDVEAEATVGLILLGAISLILGMAKGAEASPTLHSILDWPTMPVLQALAARSPQFENLLNHASPFRGLLMQAAVVVLPMVGVGCLYLLLTQEGRRIKRLAHKQISAEQEAARIAEAKRKIAAKRPATPDQGAQNGEAASSEGLRNFFRQRRG